MWKAGPLILYCSCQESQSHLKKKKMTKKQNKTYVLMSATLITVHVLGVIKISLEKEYEKYFKI